MIMILHPLAICMVIVAMTTMTTAKSVATAEGLEGEKLLAPLPPITESLKYISRNTTFPQLGPKIGQFDVCPVQEGPFVIIDAKVSKLDYQAMCCQMGLYPANIDTVNFILALKTAYACSGANSYTRIGGWMKNGRDDNVFQMGDGPFSGTVSHTGRALLKIMCQKMPSGGSEDVCRSIKFHDKSLIITDDNNLHSTNGINGLHASGAFVKFDDLLVKAPLPPPSAQRQKQLANENQTPLPRRSTISIVEMIDGKLVEGGEGVTGKIIMNDGTYFQYVTSDSSDDAERGGGGGGRRRKSGSTKKGSKKQ